MAAGASCPLLRPSAVSTLRPTCAGIERPTIPWRATGPGLQGPPAHLTLRHLRTLASLDSDGLASCHCFNCIQGCIVGTTMSVMVCLSMQVSCLAGAELLPGKAAAAAGRAAHAHVQQRPSVNGPHRPPHLLPARAALCADQAPGHHGQGRDPRRH